MVVLCARITSKFFTMPKLFNKNEFKDNCGFGLIANINGIQSESILTKSIDALVSMTHRGGVGAPTPPLCVMLTNASIDLVRIDSD